MPVARAFAEVSQAQSGPGPGLCINLLGVQGSREDQNPPQADVRAHEPGELPLPA